MAKAKPTIRRPPYDEVVKGDVWRTPAFSGEAVLEILSEPFEWGGELWVACKRQSQVHPSCESVSWILMGGVCDSRRGEG